MALTIDQLTATTKQFYVPKLVDNIYDEDALLMRSKDKIVMKVGGGTVIRQPVAYALGTAGGWYQGADSLDISDTDEFSAAEYAWKQLYQNVVITGYDRMVNSGSEAVLDFVKEKVKNAGRAIRNNLATGLYSDGSTSDSIVGLRDICDTDQTVGGISQSTYSWWAAQQDTTTTTITIPALMTQYTAASINNSKPTIVTTTRAIFNRYSGLLQPQQRFADAKTGNAGFQNLLFLGVPVVVSSKCPASHLFMINEEFLHLYVHKERNFEFEDFKKLPTQDVTVGSILWMGALGSSANRMHASFTGLTA